MQIYFDAWKPKINHILLYMITRNWCSCRQLARLS